MHVQKKIKSAVYPNKEFVESQQGISKKTCLLVMHHHRHGGKNELYSDRLISQDQS